MASPRFRRAAEPGQRSRRSGVRDVLDGDLLTGEEQPPLAVPPPHHQFLAPMQALGIEILDERGDPQTGGRGNDLTQAVGVLHGVRRLQVGGAVGVERRRPGLAAIVAGTTPVEIGRRDSITPIATLCDWHSDAA